MNAPGLTYYPDSEPGILRKPRGRGFSYFDPDGQLITDQLERDRLAQLAVPPAYVDVWMSPIENGHLRATGRDAKGRKQYLYHPDWTRAQAEVKFEQLAGFGAALPRIRRRVQKDLDATVGEKVFALAAAVTLIDRTGLRVGSPQYAAENGTYGALTLRNKHVSLAKNAIDLRYRAKGGQQVRRKLSDAKLARVLGKINDLPGATLLSWVDDDGIAQTLSSEALNSYISEAGGLDAGITAKTFRTWAGSCAALEVALTGEATIKDMADAAAKVLRNTPTIARNSYVHPDVIALAGAPAPDIAPRERSGLRLTEQRLLGLLEN
ncbi:DNA topoisomerase IB [Yoonia sp. R2331]|uniref:DNA topoisomerase IB n=1 Tax=Yoonia sp. R2331 TaxID=3237238 RepID=UPI0034E3B835